MPRRIGRYELHEAIASGGMAVVHLGRFVGPVGFSRTLALKRLHPHLATDSEFAAMFLDEARLAARVQHPNVVATRDVVVSDGELFLVMDYVLGASLSELLRAAAVQGERVPPAVACAVVVGALYGLHAAHEACDERGERLMIVHRDVSPQNILVGADGVARIVDFGIAKAASRLQSTRDGTVKGKLAFMSPEQILRQRVDQRADVYAAGVVLWQVLAGRQLFAADDTSGVIAAVLEGEVPSLARVRSDVPPSIDEALRRTLNRDVEARFETALDFAAALEAVIVPAPQRDVSAWVARLLGPRIDEQRTRVTNLERTPAMAPAAEESAVERLAGHPRSPDDARKLAAMATEKHAAPAMQAPAAVTISTPATRSGRGRGRPWLAVALAVAIGAVFEANVHLLARTRGDPSIAMAQTPPPAPSGEAPGLPPETANVPPPASAVVANAATATTPAAPVVDESPTKGAGPRPGAKRSGTSGRPGAALPPSARKPDCDPSYRLDSNGVKRFKPWCL
ncbi:serine/threonine-protein kinase [Pendulispora albinea]|uniref:Serine/threonine protein kinase n=1 Tax=Pendulispora albinea TaxID=2741071 RepID=A0ABZ2M0D7_9BACT